MEQTTTETQQQSPSQQETQPVVCGFVLDTIPAEQDKDAFVNKIGGRPVWMNDQVWADSSVSMAPPPSIPQCRSCHRLMVLLAQLYVPNEEYDRVLYVFGCRWGRCGNKRGTWMAIRGQVRAQDEGENSNANEDKNNTIKSNNDNDTCHNTQNNKSSSSTGNKNVTGNNGMESEKPADSQVEGLDEDLASLLKLRDQKQQHHHQSTRPSSSPSAHENTKKKGKSRRQHEPKWMPAKELETEDEPTSEDEDTDNNNDMHNRAAQTGGTMAGENLEDLPETETDDVFMQFERRLQRAPGQVVRWTDAPDTEPLWAREGYRPRKIPPCSVCGNPRQFELQILPTALWKLGVEEEGMDFGVVCIYTCSSSGCFNNGYTEEFVWVQPPL